MKVELHCHTKLHSACSRISLPDMAAMAEACGYDVLYLTDHGKIWSERELAGVREWTTTLTVLPGIEIQVSQGTDILVLGAADPVYERLISPSDIFAQACADGCVTVVAHPFRWVDELPDYCRLADAIEVRTCNHPREDAADKARAYAEKHNLAPVYASDAHGLNFMNRFWLETADPFETTGELRHALLQGRYTNCARNDNVELPPTYKAGVLDELAPADRVLLPEEQPIL